MSGKYLRSIALVFSVLTIFGFSANAGPLHMIFGSGVPAYHQHINKKFLEYYNRNFFDFSKRMEKSEYEYVLKCVDKINSWSFHLPQGDQKDQSGKFPLSPLRISIEMQDGKVKHGKIAVSCPLNSKEDFSSFKKIVKSNGLSLDSRVDESNYFWLEWNLSSGGITYYFFSEGKLIAKNSVTKESSFEELSRDEVAVRHPYLDVAFYAGLKDSDGLYYLELTSFDTRLVHESVRDDLYKILKDTGFMADSMKFDDSNNAVFYYP